MPYHLKSSLLCYQIRLILFVSGAILLTSCGQKVGQIDLQVKSQLKKVDSLSIVGKQDSALKLLNRIRADITTSNPVICDYYCYVVQCHTDKPAIMNLYADSALAYFKNDSRKANYPDEYFQSLLAKGDASLKAKKYVSALNYYYKGKRVLSINSCDDGYLSTKMGTIYFSQKNFALAAKYWADSYHKLRFCNKSELPEKLFFIKQGALNNAGFSYDKAGVLDSALKYYNEDLKLISDAEKNGVIGLRNIQSARAVVYDNLGGINLKQGNLPVAEEYLKRAIAVSTRDGAHIPPLLKLADIYMRLGQLDKATTCLQQSRDLLNIFYIDNPDLNITWNKIYSEYLTKINQPAKAYQYLSTFIRLRDSSDKTSTELYRLDVEKELNTLQQQNDLSDLGKQNQVKITYIAGIGIIALLSIAILVLINRNLIKTKRNHREATLHNQQLQNTLAELEHVNKNYIRIMRVMAHDLRNPLSGMTGLAALLLTEDDFSEDNKHMLQLIETTGTHSMAMINELLKSGLADENEQITKEPLDIKSLLYDSVELLQFKAKEKDQQLTFESDNKPIMANVNHEKIWRVFNNLIVNAIKFSHQSGIIHIGIKRDNDNILISIADSGIGIPDKDKATVFEMFTPAKKVGTNGEQPFGLGLSISKKIIELHKGTIWFESTANVGTTFYIKLPATI